MTPSETAVSKNHKKRPHAVVENTKPLEIDCETTTSDAFPKDFQIEWVKKVKVGDNYSTNIVGGNLYITKYTS